MATVRGNGCRCVQTHWFPFGNVLYIDLSYPGKWAVNVLALENTSGDAHALRFAIGLRTYMVSRNSTQLLNVNTTKFQVEREPV